MSCTHRYQGVTQLSIVEDGQDPYCMLCGAKFVDACRLDAMTKARDGAVRNWKLDAAQASDLADVLRRERDEARSRLVSIRQELEKEARGEQSGEYTLTVLVAMTGKEAVVERRDTKCTCPGWCSFNPGHHHVNCKCEARNHGLENEVFRDEMRSVLAERAK
jgi:hypothetical protein